MRSRIAGTLLLAALLCLLAAAGGSRALAASGPGPGWIPVGNLEASLLLVPDLDEFLRQWKQETPRVTTTDSVRQGKQVAAVVLFSGCAADAANQCRATVHFTVYRPDGSKDSEQSGDLWRGPAPAAGVVQLGVTIMTLTFAAPGPTGTYRIAVAIKDGQSGQDLALESPLDVLPRQE